MVIREGKCSVKGGTEISGLVAKAMSQSLEQGDGVTGMWSRNESRIH